jgi:F-type H+-transporting ATPase subunit epsilon
MSTFPLTITKLDGVVYSSEAESVTAPGADGELTVLKNHVPLLTPLKEGKIIVRNAGETFEFLATKGILEVSKKGVTILL